MRQAEMLREVARQRAFAGRGGTVDGDDHANSAPSALISGRKVGKARLDHALVVDRNGAFGR